MRDTSSRFAPRVRRRAVLTGALAPVAQLALGAAHDASRGAATDLAALRAFLDRDRSYSAAARGEAEAAFAQLKVSAATLSPAAFQLAVAHTAALARNGHTMLLPGLWAFDFPRIALRTHLFADGLHVLQAPDALRDLSGARVVSIDGHAVDGLRHAFGRYYGGREGKRDEWLGFFVECPALLHAAGLARADDRVEVTLHRGDGDKVTHALTAEPSPPQGERFDFLDTSRLAALAPEHIAPPAATPLYLQGLRRAFAVQPLPELRALYLQLRINKSYYEQKIDAFLARAHAALDRMRPRHVVLDLRLDGGGDLNTTRTFLQQLPRRLPRDGRIVVLTSGRTFSAGIASAGYLKQAAPSRVTIIGEPIGDYLEFWAEGGFIELPVCKAVLLASTERHNYQTGCPEADCHRSIRLHPIRVASLEPDVAAPLTYADYRAGRDPALEATAKTLR